MSEPAVSTLRVCVMRDAICPHGTGCPYVGDGPYGYPCKEGWNKPRVEPARSTDVASDDLIEALLIDALREWYGGDRYARDYEYIDANYSEQMRHLLRYVLARISRAPITEAVAWINPDDLEYLRRGDTLYAEVFHAKGGNAGVPLFAHPLPQGEPADTNAAALAAMEARKDGAYEERNKVVAALARVFPSGLKSTSIEGWSDDWHGCVYIDLPTGQVSWHFHDSQATLFDGLPPYKGEWDGHDTDEKYRRLAALTHPLGEAGDTDELVEWQWRISEKDDWHTVSTIIPDAETHARDIAKTYDGEVRALVPLSALTAEKQLREQAEEAIATQNGVIVSFGQRVVELTALTVEQDAAYGRLVGVQRTRAEAAEAALAAAETQMRAKDEALENARQEIVLAVAFLGRDAGTDRLPATITGLIERLVKADTAIRAALAPVTTPPEQEQTDAR